MMTVQKKKGSLYSSVVAEHELVKKANIFKDTEQLYFSYTVLKNTKKKKYPQVPAILCYTICSNGNKFALNIKTVVCLNNVDNCI